jgi:hypothetical protein
MTKTTDFPYLLLIGYEEAYKMFPSPKSHVYRYLKDLNRQFEVKRKSIENQIQAFKKQKDDDTVEVLYQKLQDIPDLIHLQSKIMYQAQENANTLRYLGLGSLYVIQRLAELDTSMISQASTWFIHNVNSKQDEDALNSSKVNRYLLRQYLTKIPEDERIKYMIVASPKIKTIVKKIEPQLYHKAETKKPSQRKDVSNIPQLK